MGDVTSGYSWVSGATVTAERLNEMLSDGVLAPAAISGKTAITAVDDADEVLIWDATDSALKRITRANLLGLLNANVITGQTAETLVADDDVVLIFDTSATALRKVTRLNLVPPLPAGTVIQVQHVSLRALTEIPNATALNDNIPVITNGVSLCSRTITPSSASNKILVQYGVTTISQGDPNQLIVFACRAGVTNALSCLYGDETSSQGISVTCAYLDSPASTAQQTYSVRATASGTSMWVNGFNSTNRQGGGVQDGAWILLSEIKG